MIINILQSSQRANTLRLAHKLFVGLSALSAQLVFVKRAGGFPNQADSTLLCTHTHTHTHKITKVDVQSSNSCRVHSQGPPPLPGGRGLMSSQWPQIATDSHNMHLDRWCTPRSRFLCSCKHTGASPPPPPRWAVRNAVAPITLRMYTLGSDDSKFVFFGHFGATASTFTFYITGFIIILFFGFPKKERGKRRKWRGGHTMLRWGRPYRWSIIRRRLGK